MKTLSKNGQMYSKLFSHCQKQYKNIESILTAYIENGQVYAIDYISKDGVNHIASNTAIAENIINFK